MDFLKQIVFPLEFMPHGHCYLWMPGLVWLHVLSDSMITLAYYSIPFTLFYFVRKRKDLPFDWMFLLFASFIVACGTTHLMEIWTLWNPSYWLSGAVKLATGLLSLATAVMLINTVPKALALPTPEQLAAVNSTLTRKSEELFASNQQLDQELHQKRRLEEELQNSVERFDLAVRASSSGLWDWESPADPDAPISSSQVWYSDRFRELLGYEKNEIPRVLENWSEQIHPDDRESVVQAFRRHTELRVPCDVEFRAKTKDGRYRWFHAHGQAVWGPSGRIIRMAGSLRDIDHRKRIEEQVHILNVELEKRVNERTAQLSRTNEELEREVMERKRAEKKLARHTEMLERSNRELKQFTHVASHDLQEPLRMVASYTQFLAMRYKGKLDEKADKFIDYAVEGAKRMQQLIRSLTRYSRAAAEDIPLEPVDSGEVLQAALSNLRDSIQRSKAKVTFGAMPQVMSDKVQLTQLFQNLVSNALKFCKDRLPEIRIDARREPEGYVFSVHDNGIGIEAEYLDRIFVIFQRLHERSEYAGSGVGLAICKKIVDRHGGRIWVESVPGKGSIFHFLIPDPPAAAGDVHEKTEVSA